MKKLKSMSAFFIALTMLTYFSACGDSEAEESISQSVAVEDSAETANATEAVTELVTEPEPETEASPETEIEKEEYAYYDRLSAEWAEYDNCNFIDCSNSTDAVSLPFENGGHVWAYKGMIYRVINRYGDTEYTTIMSYDMEGNSKVLFEKDDRCRVYFRSGTFLIYYEISPGWIRPDDYDPAQRYNYIIMDTEGNKRSVNKELKEYSSGKSTGLNIGELLDNEIITANGDVIVKSNIDDEMSENYEQNYEHKYVLIEQNYEHKYVLIKNGSTEAIEIPAPPEDYYLYDYYWFEDYSYSGKVYAKGYYNSEDDSQTLYCFDCDTLEWSVVLSSTNVNVKNGQVKFHKIISFYSCCSNALVFILQGHFFCQ